MAKEPAACAISAYEKDTFATTSALPNDDDHKSAMAELTREVVEFRIAQYLDRGPFRVKVNHNASGNPILMPLDRDRYPSLPSGWKDVLIEGENYKANFAKIAVNVVKQNDEDKNQLPKILRRWFGPAAGESGTKQFVLVSGKGGRWKLRPEDADLKPMADDGQRQLDATFNVYHTDDGYELVFEARGGTGNSTAARNTEYTKGLQVVLERLAAAGAVLKDVLVDSKPARKLPIDERRVVLEDWQYPLELKEVSHMEKLVSALGKGKAAIGRPPTAKGAGNSTKRISLKVEADLESELLRKRLLRHK
jgi:hypothetical protein